MPEATILIIEDEALQRQALCGFLKKKQYRVLEAAGRQDALHTFASEIIDLVLSDMRLPGGSGEDILEQVKAVRPDIPFILMTAYGNTQQAVSAMKKGAADYITKLLDLNELDLIIQRELERSTLLSENRVLREIIGQQGRAQDLITESPAMQAVVNTARPPAASDASNRRKGERSSSTRWEKSR